MVNNSLTHYGVKGMKWGVRKDRDRVKQFNYYTESATSGKDFVVDRKSPMYRVTSQDETNIGDRTYVSLTPDDAIKYVYGDWFSGTEYLDVYNAKDPINVAGYETAVKILAESYDLPLKDIPDPGTYYDRHRFFDYGDQDDVESPLANRISDASDIFMDRPEKFKTYADNLKNKGYDAVVDLVDLEIDINTPIIVLDKNKIERGKHYVAYTDEMDWELDEAWKHYN